jgi:hypothetical protein
MAQRGHVVTRRAMAAMPADLTPIDLAKFIDEREKWTRLFKEIFVRQAR